MSSFQLQSQIVVSFGTTKTEDGELETEYILDIGAACDGSSYAVSLSDGSFRVYGAGSSGPSSLIAHQYCGKPVQALKCSSHSPSILYTAFSDGTATAWDIRSPAPTAQRVHLKLGSGEELMAMDLSHMDTLLAVAAGNSVYFHDMRKAMSSNEADHRSSPLGQYSDCHSDLVTHVRFNKDRQSVLTSAAEDGLLCTFDTSAPPNSEAVISVLNTECPVRNFFYFGQDSSGICCLSTVETLSCWHYPSAQRICGFSDIRSAHGLDYLVDGWYVGATDSLCVLGGDYDGNASVLGVSPGSLSVVASLQGGHTATIRSCAYTAPLAVDAAACIITGAEDAKLCSWSSAKYANELGKSTLSRPIKSTSRGIGPGTKPY